MKKVEFLPAKLSGEVLVPPSKSYGHRALICTALAGGGDIHNFAMSRDMEATLNLVKALGLDYSIDGKSISIFGDMAIPQIAAIDCIESGSTLRFVIPILAALGAQCEFIGEGRLPQRPIGIFQELFKDKGIACKGDGLPFYINGKLKSGDFYIPGNISSQFISGLMFALPLLDGDSRIILTTELESKPYVDMTITVLKEYSISVEETDQGYFIKGGQKYKKADYTVEGDWSQAAFFLTMGAFSQKGIKLCGLNMNSVQGDKKALEIYKKIGAVVSEKDKGLYISKGQLKALSFNGKDIPDAIPAIAMCLALAEGRSVIHGAERLRLKESDRIKAVVNAINAMGGKAQESEDGLIIDGVSQFTGGNVEGCNDHRILMSVAAAAEKLTGPLYASDPYSVNKSYPDFYKDYVNLGGAANVIDLG